MSSSTMECSNCNEEVMPIAKDDEGAKCPLCEKPLDKT